MKQATEDQINDVRQYGEKTDVRIYARRYSPGKILETLRESLQMDYSNIQFVNNKNLMFVKHTYAGMKDVLY